MTNGSARSTWSPVARRRGPLNSILCSTGWWQWLHPAAVSLLYKLKVKHFPVNSVNTLIHWLNGCCFLGVWLCGILVSGELFLWNRDKDLLKTAAAAPEVVQVITSGQGTCTIRSKYISLFLQLLEKQQEIFQKDHPSTAVRIRSVHVVIWRHILS